MRMRISCLPTMRCHIFVKASPIFPQPQQAEARTLRGGRAAADEGFA
eukprot:CAMPEP_0168482854 /NCGR_PEP_ID=MMETSP0228-20121227/65254_1 /TAXON_ID=133427 /ORGANISM="Protoceratium reticulatum, Strain CCCM 535 (=CCMP 1889)" /LENGTH=46 /DNA_ID= /DNA_START= /DNA_END= /DNA_ORIENTATION=